MVKFDSQMALQKAFLQSVSFNVSQNVSETYHGPRYSSRIEYKSRSMKELQSKMLSMLESQADAGS